MKKVSVRKLVDWDVALDSARFTARKEPLLKEPSNRWRKAACLSEHSMIRDVRFIVEIYDIEYFAACHLRTHDNFAKHDVYIASQRTDKTGIDRSELPQTAPTNQRINLSAQDFLNISCRRLCSCASKETREAWQEVIDELEKIDPVLASCCVPTCIYRGFCPEFKCCGYDKTDLFKKKLEEYRNVD